MGVDLRRSDVRMPEELLDRSQVLAVFQGHSHSNSHKLINDIHYCVLNAMIEGSGKANNGYATMDLFDDGVIQVSGHRKQNDYRWPKT